MFLGACFNCSFYSSLLFSLFPYLSISTLPLIFTPVLILPPPHPCWPLLFSPPSIIRYPPACPGRVPGARVGAAGRSLLQQAPAAGAAVWLVQSGQLAAAGQRPGLHRLRHQVHRAGQPGGFLGRLPEWGAAGGPEGRFHHRLPEDGGRFRRCPSFD